MTCNDKCIHFPVCEQKKYDFANIDECQYYEEKRPHGKWLTTSNPNHSPFDNTRDFICMCSKCTYSSGDRITAYWNYCPNCGTPMISSNSEIKKSKSEIVPDYRDGCY